MTGPIDFATVQWARKMTAIVQNMIDLPPDDLRKLADLAEKLAEFRQNEGALSEQQMQVILQNLHTKTLVRLTPHKGGAFVEFTGGSFEYEKFLVRADGRVPNNRYEAKKQDRG